MAKAKTDGAADAEQGAAAGAAAPVESVESVDSTLGYEQARDELIEVVRSLEAGGTTLEESLALWERGEALAKVCRRWLDGARARLDAALAQSPEGPEAERA
ncbi:MULTISPECIES: exodeoxyribonuclease VII small subunit [unclassified Streptomyces]|uniref:exodeoxyribonuclease VII small subunit n=1 Tax=unclassified Streptomyces TaxID=2593676 RepID=UPI00088F9652|nr:MULTISPECIES: exodeoxyribonuclease VII small subunit [unclassified Streptomyces]PBC84833.1 exodeoxyribonuclease VII small subunit [Streptomyces sp. 2321.6]SDR25960.1 Exodeoxyribonuclease VII small subunit [Streptomyces sp. KS_16]SED46212.1 Exodeoxyribonuclease VII small subunit [Streptomyces sp. 2133.1]SNC70856.1 exodeoxyribonuclease VII small subunit [Streptomyces sp. 2114.4]